MMRSTSLLDSAILPCLPLLINKSHRKLPNINWVIWIILILVDNIQICVLHGLLLLLFIDVWWVTRSLNWAETASLFLVTMLIDYATSSSWRYHINLLLASLLLTHFLARLIRSLGIWILTHVNRGICSSRCRWEKSFWLSWYLILGVIKCSIILSLSRWSGTCCNTSHMGGIGSVTVFSFDRLYHGIIEFHNQIIVNFVLLGRFGLSNWWISTAIASSSLCSSMVSCDSLIMGIVLHVDVFASMLDRLIIKRIISGFANIVRRDKIIDFAIFDLLWVYRSCHVEVYLFRLSRGIIWWLVSVIVDHSFVGCINGHLLFGVISCIPHSHLFLEIDFGELVALLSILDFLVPFVN